MWLLWSYVFLAVKLKTELGKNRGGPHHWFDLWHRGLSMELANSRTGSQSVMIVYLFFSRHFKTLGGLVVFWLLRRSIICHFPQTVCRNVSMLSPHTHTCHASLVKSCGILNIRSLWGYSVCHCKLDNVVVQPLATSKSVNSILNLV